MPSLPQRKQQQQQSLDLFGDNEPAVRAAPVSTPASPPKPPVSQPKPADSLLGLDFFGAAPTPDPRPSSVNSDPGKMTSASSRPDLNRSILSLYASAPRATQPPPQSPQQQPGHRHRASSGFGGLADTFSGLSFGATSPPPAPVPAPAKPSPFANLTSGFGKSPAAPQLSSGGGNFFTPVTKPAPPLSSGLGDLFDFGAPAVAAAPTPKPAASLAFDANVWSSPAPAASNSNDWGAPVVTASNSNGWGAPAAPAIPASVNAWASAATSSSSNAWATAAPAPAPAHATTAANNSTAWGAASNTFSSSSAWGAPAPAPAPPKQQQQFVPDEDGWGDFNTGGAMPAPAAQPVKFDDDVFGNVWK